LAAYKTKLYLEPLLSSSSSIGGLVMPSMNISASSKS